MTSNRRRTSARLLFGLCASTLALGCAIIGIVAHAAGNSVVSAVGSIGCWVLLLAAWGPAIGRGITRVWPPAWWWQENRILAVTLSLAAALAILGIAAELIGLHGALGVAGVIAGICLFVGIVPTMWKMSSNSKQY